MGYDGSPSSHPSYLIRIGSRNMSSTAFRPYRPGEKPYAPRKDAHSWEAHRELLTSMHHAHQTRGEMLRVLRSRGFGVSQGQLTRQMKKWNLRVEDLYHTTPLSYSSVDQSQVQTMAQTDEEHGSENCRVPADSDDFSVNMIALASDELQQHHGHYFEVTLPVGASQSSSSQPTEANTVQMPPGNDSIAGDAEPVMSENQQSASNLSRSIPEADVDEDESMEIAISTDAIEYWLPTELFRNPELAHRRFKLLSLGAWESLRPNTCCCEQIVAVRYPCQAKFAIWWDILDKCRSERSLKYPVTLLFLWLASNGRETSPDYNTRIRGAAKQYQGLAGRSRNATPLIHQLARLLSDIYAFLNEGGPFVVSQGLHWSRTLTEVREFLGELTLGHFGSSWCTPAGSQLEAKRTQSFEAMWCDILLILVVCSQCLMKNLKSLLESLDMQKLMDLQASSRHPQPVHAGSHTSVNIFCLALSIGQFLEKLLRSPEYSAQVKSAHIDVKIWVRCFVPIGYLIARSLFIITFKVDERLDTKLNLTVKDLTAIIRSLDCTFGADAEHLKGQRLRENFEEAYWVCAVGVEDHSQKQDFHDGECMVSTFWDSLDTELSVPGMPQAWVEKSLGSLRQSLPFSNTADFADSVSIRTSSSDNSFTRLQALSIRLKRNKSTSSLGSTRSKWSGHLSERSWRLENIMQVDEEDTSAPLEKKKHNQNAEGDGSNFEEMLMGISSNAS